jgi:hypothetical protein
VHLTQRVSNIPSTTLNAMELVAGELGHGAGTEPLWNAWNVLVRVSHD